MVQCLVELRDCEEIRRGYRETVRARRECEEDNHCIYQDGKCALADVGCYVPINWQAQNTLVELMKRYKSLGCTLGERCKKCGSSPSGAVCREKICVLSFPNSDPAVGAKDDGVVAP